MSRPSLVVLPSTAWGDAELSALDLRVLMAIAAHCRQADRAAWPSQRTIAESLGVTRESVCRSVGKLSKRGHIQVEHVFGAHGEQRSSRYFVPLDVTRPSHPLCADDHTPCDAAVTPPVMTVITPPVIAAITPRTDHDEHITMNISPASLRSAGEREPRDVDRPPAGNLEPPAKKPRARSAETRAERATRLPPDWEASDANRQFARNEGLTPQETEREAAIFRDYWHAKPGAAGRHRDWDGTWRNWIRRTADRRRAKPGRGYPAESASDRNERQTRERLAAALGISDPAGPSPRYDARDSGGEVIDLFAGPAAAGSRRYS